MMRRVIHASGEKLIVKAPVINHTDDNLNMLEALAGRVQGLLERPVKRTIAIE